MVTWQISYQGDAVKATQHVRDDREDRGLGPQRVCWNLTPPCSSRNAHWGGVKLHPGDGVRSTTFSVCYGCCYCFRWDALSPLFPCETQAWRRRPSRHHTPPPCRPGSPSRLPPAELPVSQTLPRFPVHWSSPARLTPVPASSVLRKARAT